MINKTRVFHERVSHARQNRASKRGRIIALLSPPLVPKPARPKKRPDFIGRLQRIYGDRVLSGNIVVADRESRPY